MLYTPAHFDVSERVLAGALMRAHPFATVVTAGDGEPVVSHLPLLLVDDADPWQLLGHVARANPHWQAMDQRASVTAVFVGGDAYISPSLYETRRAVPTWNYAVVHAYGTVRLMHDSDSKEQVLKSLIDRHDAAYRSQWDELDPAYREGMKGGIVALVITIERLQAKFKLSQNRSATERARVLDAMERGDDKSRALGGWMRALGEPRK